MRTRSTGGRRHTALMSTSFPMSRVSETDTTGPVNVYQTSGDFSRIPLASSHTAYEEAQGPGPVSQTGPSPAPAPEVKPPPAPPPPAPCTLTTRTLAAAPDGTAANRRRVGVNEQVEMTASTLATWTAACGAVAPASGATVTWTAPTAGGTCTVTATPTAPSTSPCSAAMTVQAPTSRSLARDTGRDRVYTAGKAGSGFVATVTVNPRDVSFSRTEVREESVAAVTTGYYTTIGWSGIQHPTGTWNRLDASNNGLLDTVGSNPPGTPAPFSAGTFLWAIPQTHRAAGGGGGAVYSTAAQRQVMTGATGEETTSKEGASRNRTP